MLKLIDYEMILYLHREGLSGRQIAKKLKHCRSTVKTALEGGCTDKKYTLTQPRPCPVVSPAVREWVESKLQTNRALPAKQRYTAHKLWKDLPKELPASPEMGASTMRRLVRQVRKSLKPCETTVPLYFAPAEESQVDWWEAEVILADEARKLQFLSTTLCYSRRTFVMAFEAANQESFCEGQLRAFEKFGGLPDRQAYDNLTSAVKKILIGGREENEYFKAFRVHHGFEARYCTPGIEGAHEKGRVERHIPTIRLNCLVPPPSVPDLAALNCLLEQACDEDAQRKHPDYPERTIQEVFSEERASFRRLPAHRYRCCKVVDCKADGHARVRYDKVTYSLPCEYGRRRVSLQAYCDRIEVHDGQTLVARWPRSYKSGDGRYDYRHYLPLLKRNPGASLNGLPYLGLPPTLIRYRRILLKELDRRGAARAMAKVLLMLVDHSEKDVVDAVTLSIAHGAYDPAAVETILHQLQTSSTRHVRPLDLSHKPQLSIAVPRAPLAIYNQLLGLARNRHLVMAVAGLATVVASTATRLGMGPMA